MVGRKSARYLAPVALVATAVGAYLIVSHHLHSTSTSGGVPPLVNSHRRGRGKFAHRSFYTVQAGDNLSTISTRTGIPVITLERLNPSLDPNSLQTGQRIRLRR
jgi:LysM repeat protein